jgi:hypothetical protein
MSDINALIYTELQDSQLLSKTVIHLTFFNFDISFLIIQRIFAIIFSVLADRVIVKALTAK